VETIRGYVDSTMRSTPCRIRGESRRAFDNLNASQSHGRACVMAMALRLGPVGCCSVQRLPAPDTSQGSEEITFHLGARREPSTRRLFLFTIEGKPSNSRLSD
jgi:hypothetical protein